MVFGIGQVRGSALLGFIIGLYAANTQSGTGNTAIQATGLISLLFGILFMFGGLGATGVGGGFLAGFGYGASAGSYLWPPLP